ncbi:unnamed protein product [Amoebophrya sp. A25]|nr:unnamed protein product [Amoebophrya sp. A25]|eukprot:GSA25T00010904001.1
MIEHFLDYRDRPDPSNSTLQIVLVLEDSFTNTL